MTTTYQLKTEEEVVDDNYKTITISIPQDRPADIMEETTVARIKEEVTRMEEEKTRYNTNIDKRIADKKALIVGIKESLKLDVTIE